MEETKFEILKHAMEIMMAHDSVSVGIKEVCRLALKEAAELDSKKEKVR
jgi:hypothetical protein